jgi:uncharacterized protein YndB with AHSA1/START domain
MSKPEFVYVTYIETTPEKLWQALTEPAFTERYWWNTRITSDWKVGSPFALVTGDGKITDTGEVLEFDPPKRLSYTFHHELNEAARKERPSRVTFVIEPHGKLVKLVLTHEDFDKESVVLGGISSGWPAILSALKTMLESGTPLDIPLTCLN